MTSFPSAEQLLQQSELLYSEVEIATVVARLANEIGDQLAHSCPLVLCVMSGAAVFAGQLLPRLQFPLEFDYLHVSRYHNRTQGDQIVWKVPPGKNVIGRSVLILDDILDEGLTLADVRKKCLQAGAKSVLIAVLTEKNISRPKPLKADFVGLEVPDRYVFGCGMDVHGWWRNLPAIYALKES